jgi:hypothetical protein
VADDKKDARSERRKSVYDHKASKRARGEDAGDSGEAEPAARAMEDKPAEKVAEKAAPEGNDMMARHKTERDDMQRRHEVERRDMAAGQRDEERTMNASHEKEYAHG